MFESLKLKLKLISEYLDGGYNIPSDKDVDAAPLIVKEKEYKPLFSDKQIDEAREWPPYGIQFIRVSGLQGFLNGSYNTPRIPEKEEYDLNDRFEIMPELYLRYGKRHYDEYWMR